MSSLMISWPGLQEVETCWWTLELPESQACLTFTLGKLESSRSRIVFGTKTEPFTREVLLLFASRMQI